MADEVDESRVTSTRIRNGIEDFELQSYETENLDSHPVGTDEVFEVLEVGGSSQSYAGEEEIDGLREEKREVSKVALVPNAAVERTEVGGYRSTDGEADERVSMEDDEYASDSFEQGSIASTLLGPFDHSPLDPEMIQLVKGRNRAAGICTACQDLFASICTKGGKPTLLYFNHHTLQSLRDSARTGCGTCRMLLESLEVYRNPKYHEPISEWFVAAWYNWRATTPDRWEIWLHPKRDGYDRAEGVRLDVIPTSAFEAEYSHSDGSQAEQNSFFHSLPSSCPEIPLNTSESLPLAKVWLDSCEANHKDCNSSRLRRHSFLPTRLLFVGDVTPRLCLTSVLSSSESVRYAALSHCWGSLVDLVRLCTENISLFQREIPPSALCKTFCDAIEVTKALMLDFLWIGSLCIIQDDPEDWRVESGLMCEVYSCCTISIAASSAIDGNGGCLFTRNPERRWIQQVEMIRKSEPTSYTVLNECSSHFQCIEDAPLSTRAWTLQEHMLAPRTLHFSSTQIFWDCREHQACESLPRGFVAYRNLAMKRNLNWNFIVEDYSSRNLTFGKDKLPALAGLAQKVQEQTTHTYIAGLWLETLACDLLWRSRTATAEFERPRRARRLLESAPSWSWASVDSKIQMPELQETYPIASMTQHSFVLGVDGLPSGKDAFGRLRAATLNIECEVLVPFRLNDCKREYMLIELPRSVFHYTGEYPFRLSIYLDHNDVREGIKYLLPLHTRIEKASSGESRFGYMLSKSPELSNHNRGSDP